MRKMIVGRIEFYISTEDNNYLVVWKPLEKRDGQRFNSWQVSVQIFMKSSFEQYEPSAFVAYDEHGKTELIPCVKNSKEFLDISILKHKK